MTISSDKRAAASEISAAMQRTIRRLQDRGHDRTDIAACMVGIGSGIVTVRAGSGATLRMLDGARDIAEAETAEANEP